MQMNAAFKIVLIFATEQISLLNALHSRKTTDLPTATLKPLCLWERLFHVIYDSNNMLEMRSREGGAGGTPSSLLAVVAQGVRDSRRAEGAWR